MARDIAADIRLDPRVKAFLADDEEGAPEGDVDSRETLLAEANSEEARRGAEEFRRFMERFDTAGGGALGRPAHPCREGHLGAGRQHDQPAGDPPGQ